jgi:predicted dehydrogenase
MTIKLAFAGTGFNKVHAQAAIQTGADLAAVVNHRPESMESFAREFNIARQYGKLEDLLAAGGFDALVVSTPNALHAEQTIAALEAGYHVLVEKPMAMNAAEAERMHITAQKTGRLLMVAHCFRFDPETAWLRAQIAAGRLGRIIRTKGSSIHVNWGPSGWFAQKKLAGGGAMADMGVHGLDTSRFLLGDPQPVSVYAKMSTNYGSYDVDDTGQFWVNWDNGATSIIETGWWQPHADQPNAGTQLFGQMGFGSLFPTYIENPGTPPAEPTVDNGGFAPVKPEDGGRLKYAIQMQYFLDCIKEGAQPCPGGADGLANMLVVDAAYESSRTGQVVTIK